MKVINEEEATYQYTSEAHGDGAFFHTDCCGNWMYSVRRDPMTYHGKLCPRCFWHGKSVTLYLRGTEDGMRVYKKNHIIKAESEE